MLTFCSDCGCPVAIGSASGRRVCCCPAVAFAADGGTAEGCGEDLYREPSSPIEIRRMPQESCENAAESSSRALDFRAKDLEATVQDGGQQEDGP